MKDTNCSQTKQSVTTTTLKLLDNRLPIFQVNMIITSDPMKNYLEVLTPSTPLHIFHNILLPV